MAWEKLGTKTLTVAADEITVLITTKKFIQTMSHGIASGNFRQDMRYNNDSSLVYAVRRNVDGTGEGGFANQSSIVIPQGGGTGDDDFMIGYHVNIAAEEKLAIFFWVAQEATGAGTAPKRSENVGKYVPSPDANVTEIKSHNLQTGDFAIDSNLSVLGTD